MARMCRYIRDAFSVDVQIVDMQAPFLGDLDGAEIRLGRRQDAEAALFTLSHLFGHTVQWNLSERARTIGGREDGRYSQAELLEIEAYELEASRYGLQLLHGIGVHDLDQWLSDFSACDLAYLKHFYLTGERRIPTEFWNEGQPLLAPLAIPRFAPRRFKYRWEGVVV
jgi:hypothetical protein